MSRYIDKDAVLTKIKGRINKMDQRMEEAADEGDNMILGGCLVGKVAYEEMLALVEAEPVAAPIADLNDRKEARSWFNEALLSSRWPEGIRECRKCGRLSLIKTNFCPDCGADMREEQKE